MASFAEVLCPGFPLHTGCNAPKGPGDRVMVGNNQGPVYEVVHIAGSNAWVRSLEQGLESLVRLDRLRLVGSGAHWPII